MHKLLVPAVVMAASLTGTAMAFAAPPPAHPGTGPMPGHMWQHRGHGRWHGGHWMRTLRQLDLSTTQRASIRSMLRADFKEARPEMVALRQKRAAFEAATPGTAEYHAAANDLGHAEADAALTRMLHHADLRTKIYQLLTPAQRAQLATLRAQRQERRQWRESHRPNAAPGAASES